MSFIPLMSPAIPETAIESVAEVLRSGMLVQGQNVAAFESEVASYLGAKNVIAVSNGTASLHLALIALGIGPGDEVIVPAFSYIATANVVEVVGATCVFVDVEADTFNIDVDQVEAAITPRTRAIIPVHEFGLACDIVRLSKIAEKHGIAMIEDAACALGATDDGTSAGTVGEIGSFSLHPRKAVTSGEGGLLATADNELAKKFKTLRNHGIDPDLEGMNFVAAGLNYRMTDFQAALVRPQFQDIDARIAKKNELASGYFEMLTGEERIKLPVVPQGKRHTWQTFHAVLDDAVDRDEFISKMKSAGVGTNFGAQCIPNEIYYRNKYGNGAAAKFPNAYRSATQGLALPLYEKLNSDDIRRVSEAVISNLRNRS